MDDQMKCKYARKHIWTAKNRLEHAAVKFNRTLAKNAHHRGHVEFITCQRSRFIGM